ncbi:hypothetical protein CMV_030804 [Castanea mollissima]|uniref:Uncharacterized protein n=1 Tax=Castanea mollissima TaxID=60419 RepID=A0A8J4Q5I5_9ROSI|nr:hypothetical protein CMV_030804 [Castanea mollissima]
MATNAVKSKKSTPSSDKTSARIWFYSLLLTLQYGAQPLISKRFIRREVIVTSSVLTCEIAKVICALFFMTKDGTLKKVYNEWTLVGALTASGLPAAIYALQNSLLQISYKNLDSLTFSMLNQTKIFFTAIFTYFIMRYVPEWHLFNCCCCCCCFGTYGFSDNWSSVKENNLLCTIINRSWRLRRCLCSFG